MEDLEDEEGEEQSNIVLGQSQSQSATQAATAAATGGVKVSFDQQWQQQSKKAGLIGALVAMAYPDRIAQKKVKGAGRSELTRVLYIFLPAAFSC
jgi:hypothetical protein